MKLRKIRFVSLVPLAMAIAVMSQNGARSETVLIDFGNAGSYRGASQSGADTNGLNWTSVNSASYFSNLADAASGNTTLGFGFSASTGLASDSYNGPAGVTSNPITQAEIDAVNIDAAALGILGGSKASAVDFYAATDGRFVVQGLNANQKYNLTFFGSHKYNAANTTDYMVCSDNTYATSVGSASLTVGVGSAHNTNATATIAGLSPQTGNTLYVRFGANGFSANGYLNELSVVGYVPYNGGGVVDLGTAKSYPGNTILGNATTVNANVAGVLGGGPSVLQVDTGGGSLVLGANQTLGGLIGSGDLALNTGGNALTINPSGSTCFKVATASNGAYQSIQYSGALSGSGTVVKTGAGTQVLSGSTANLFSGTIVVNAGTLVLGKDAGVRAISGDITLGDGVGADILMLAADHQISDTSILTLSGVSAGQRGWFQLNGRNETIGGLASASSGAGLVANEGTANSVLTLNVAGSQTFSGLVRNGNNTTGLLALVKDGPGTQVLSGVNTYSGGTTVSGGVLSFANGSLGGSGSISMNGGTLQWFGTNTQDVSQRLLCNNGTTATFDTNGNNVTFASSLGSGTSASIIKTGAGVLTLTGVSNFTGSTTVNAGTLALSGSGSIASSTTINLAAGTTLDVSALASGLVLGSSQTLNFDGPGAVINGSINCSSGTVSIFMDGGNPGSGIATAAMTLSTSTVLKIHTGSTIVAPGTYKILAKGQGTITGTVPRSVTVISGSTTYQYPYSLSLVDGELFMTVPTRDHSIVVMGSSVAQGYGSSSSLTTPPTMLNGSDTTGYAGLLQDIMIPLGWTMNNISIGGHNTQNGLDRYAADLAPLAPSTKFAWFGYSLANELLHGSSNPAGTVATFETNLGSLITQSRNSGFYPMVGLNYPRNFYTAGEYEYVKSTNLKMNAWDVPSTNFMGVMDDGSGHYISGYYYNDTHPNDAGYQEMFYAIVPSLFDAINAGKTTSPQLAAANRFARLSRVSGVTVPLAFTPSDPMHSYTVSFRVRSTHDGTIAVVRSGANHNTLELRNGSLVYRSASGQEISAPVHAEKGGWHDVALAYRHALQKTVLFADGVQAGEVTGQYVPDQFVLGGPSSSGRPETPVSVDFQNWCVYRSAWNLDEAVAQMQGNRQQASMEICAGLDDVSFASGSPVTNRAQSLSVAVVQTNGMAAVQGIVAPGNLTVQGLPGSSASIAWVSNSTAETGFVIERRLAGSPDWSELVTLPAGSTNHTDTGLSIGVTYEYRVTALEGDLRSGYSNSASVVTGLGNHPLVLIDFGPNDGTNGNTTVGPDGFGQYWNNLVGAGGGAALPALSLSNLVTTGNVATTIGLASSATGWAANGILNGGLLSPSSTLLGNFAVASATQDYFLTTSSASLTFSNLDPGASYRLRMFGTRNTTETRVTRYAVTGGNGSFSSDLTTSGTGIGSGGYNGNNNTIATINGITPTVGGQIQLGVTRLSGTFAHLGILELMPNHPPLAHAMSLTAKAGQSLTVDVIYGPNAPTDADGDGLVVSSVNGAGAAVQGTNGFTFLSMVPGVHQFDYTVSDPYGGTSTKTVTVTVQPTYEAWASQCGIAGSDFDADNDGDGMSNGVEYAMGANPGSPTASPVLVASGSNFVLTYPKGESAANDPALDFAFEISADLKTWNHAAPSNEDATSVSYTLEGGSQRSFVRFKVTRVP